VLKKLYNGWESFYSLSLLPSYSNILKYEDFINRYIYIYLLGGISVLDELQFDTVEWGTFK